MQSADFVQPYRPVVPETEWRADSYSDLLQESRAYSHRFGQKLHQHLSTGDASPESANEGIAGYTQWTKGYGLAHLVHKLFERADLNPEQYVHAASELNFHTMNTAMYDLWRPIFNVTWESPKARAASFNQTIRTLSKTGLLAYSLRDEMMGSGDDYYYFSDEAKIYRQTIEGQLNEFDTAIVLTRIARDRPGLTVVPAPMQFEHDQAGKNGTNRNADFIVLDDRGRAVGVQAKGFVGDKHVTNYDKQRILLVDGRRELGNERNLRTSRVNSARVVGHAGQIVAHIATIPQQGEYRQNRGNKQPIAQMWATREKLGGVSPYYDKAAKGIGSRIMSALAKS